MTRDRDADDYLAKALESLASAEAELNAGRYNSCMNRCYFACFQAAVSTLIREGVISANTKHEHDDVQRQFNVNFIRRRKMFPQRMARVLREMIVLRHDADYRPVGISRNAAMREVARARDYVRIIELRYS